MKPLKTQLMLAGVLLLGSASINAVSKHDEEHKTVVQAETSVKSAFTDGTASTEMKNEVDELESLTTYLSDLTKKDFSTDYSSLNDNGGVKYQQAIKGVENQLQAIKDSGEFISKKESASFELIRLGVDHVEQGIKEKKQRRITKGVMLLDLGVKNLNK